MTGIDLAIINQVISILIIASFTSLAIAFGDKARNPNKSIKNIIITVIVNDATGTITGITVMGISTNLMLSWGAAGLGSMLGLDKMKLKLEKWINKKMGVDEDAD